MGGELVVLGLGNLLLRDEGVGVHVIQLLEEVKLSGAVLVDGGTAGENLLFWIENAAGLIVIDSIDCGAEPGTVFRFRPGDFELTSVSDPSSVHDMRFQDVLRLAEIQGVLPPVVIFAVQIGEIEWGLELSAPVAAALKGVAEAVRTEAMYWNQHHCFVPIPRVKSADER